MARPPCQAPAHRPLALADVQMAMLFPPQGPAFQGRVCRYLGGVTWMPKALTQVGPQSSGAGQHLLERPAALVARRCQLHAGCCSGGCTWLAATPCPPLGRAVPAPSLPRVHIRCCAWPLQVNSSVLQAQYLADKEFTTADSTVWDALPGIATPVLLVTGMLVRRQHAGP